MKNHKKNHLQNIGFLLLALVLLSVLAFSNEGRGGVKVLKEPEAMSPIMKKVKNVIGEIKQGNTLVEFSVHQTSGEENVVGGPMEGDEIIVQFTLSDIKKRSAISGLHPSAWMDIQRGKPGMRMMVEMGESGEMGELEEDLCKDKVKAFMQGTLTARPLIDLNTYYILSLNEDPSITVLDPHLSFGGTKLLTMIPLQSPGVDWVLSQGGQRLFVTLPGENKLAVIDTSTWKVIADPEVGDRPTRVALQPDGKYLWIGNDAGQDNPSSNGVTIFDPVSLKRIKQIKTGRGHHEIAFTADSRYAFVSDQKGDTLSIIEIATLSKIKEITIGRSPSSIAFSKSSQALYVVNEGDGTIVVLDGQNHEILASIKTLPGVRNIHFSPGGRWGFVTNTQENRVLILDTSTHRLYKDIKVSGGPDQVSFTETFAYIRSVETKDVRMIRLESLNQGEDLSLFTFQGGQKTPGASSGPGITPFIIPTPERVAVLIANPADKTIHYYKEGMNALMGSFQNEGRAPKGLLIWDRSLRETRPGTYVSHVKLPASGIYDVAFLLAEPRILHCFQLTVRANPELIKQGKKAAYRVESVLKKKNIQVGEDVRFQFKLLDANTNQPEVGLKDVRVLTLLSPGIWQRRSWAKPVDNGIYEVTLRVPKKGVYFIFFESAKLNVQFDDIRYLIVHGVDRG